MARSRPDNPPAAVRELSVQVVGPGADPAPDPEHPGPGRSVLIPALVLLVGAAFAAGYLLARSATGAETPASTTVDTVTTTTADPSTTTTTVTIERAPWTALPPHQADRGVIRISTMDWIIDVAVAADGHVWTVGGGTVVRWDPSDGSRVEFRDEFGYASLVGVATAPDGTVWTTSADELYRYRPETGWMRFELADFDITQETFVDVEVSPEGEVLVLAARWTDSTPSNDDHSRIYRGGPDGDPVGEVMRLPLSEVYDLTVAPDGVLWLSGGLDGRSVWSLDGTSLMEWPDLPSGDRPTYIAAGDDVWAAAGGPRWWDGQTWAALPLPVNPGPGLAGGAWLVEAAVDGGAWFAGKSEVGPVLFRVAQNEGTAWVEYPPFEGATTYPSSLTVHPDGTVWLGTLAGLLEFDPATTSWSVFPGDPAASGALESIESMAVASDGTLWVAGYDGLQQATARFDGSTWSAGPSPLSASCEPGECYFRVTAGSDGTVWAMVFRPTFEAETLELWRREPDAGWTRVEAPDGDWALSAPAAGPSGTFWLVGPDGTAVFEGVVWTVYAAGVAGTQPWQGMTVAADGTAWAVQNSGFAPQLLRFDEGVWSPAAPALPDPAIWSVRAGADGAVWAAGGGRVWRLDGSGWTLEFEAPGWVSDIAPGPAGGVWVGGSDLWLIGAGAARLVAPGLEAWQLAPAPDGSVWVLGAGGLYHVERPG